MLAVVVLVDGLGGIDQQVQEDLTQARRVPGDAWNVRVLPHEAGAVPDLVPAHSDRCLEEVLDVQHLLLFLGNSREAEDVGDDLAHPLKPSICADNGPLVLKWDNISILI